MEPYNHLKDIEEDATEIENLADGITENLRRLANEMEQDADETVILFPGRREIVVQYAEEETLTRLSQFAHLVDSTEDAMMYKIRQEDVWQSPYTILDELIDDLRTVLSQRSPHLEEWIERHWGRAHQFTLRTHDDGFTVLESKDPEKMKDVARRKLSGKKHLYRHLSDTESRVVDGKEADVKQTLYKAGYPVQDFRDLERGAELGIQLTEDIELRDYQTMWRDRFMERGSGVFVGPSGSGKTVSAIGVMEAVGGETLVLVPSRELVKQWKRELLDKTNLSERQIGEYHGDRKEIKPVTIATYHTAGTSRHRKLFEKREWGLIVYDEVHHIPSMVYKRTAKLQTRHRLGLSASPVREDKKEEEIFTLVGPPVGTDWASLFKEGFVQEPEVEIRYVPWSSDAQRKKYRRAEGHEKRQVASLNPAKVDEINELLEEHRSDKTLIFVEWLDQGKQYSEELGIPFISGETRHSQRDEYFDQFRNGEQTKLIVSRVGDEGIDLPDAEVVIVASGLGGSRRQGTQRTGRVMRPQGDAQAYILATKGSNEEDFAQRQTQHLQEKGIAVSEIEA